MKDDETSKSYFARVTEIVNQIKILGGTLDDQQVVEKVLRSLPKSYNHIVFAILEAHDTKELSVTELMGSLQSHEDLFSKDQQTLEKAFSSNMNIKQKPEKKNYQNRKQPSQSNTKDRRDNRVKTTHENQGNSATACTIRKKQNHQTRDCFFRCKKCKIQNHSADKCWFKKNEEANFTETETEKPKKIHFHLSKHCRKF